MLHNGCLYPGDREKRHFGVPDTAAVVPGLLERERIKQSIVLWRKEKNMGKRMSEFMRTRREQRRHLALLLVLSLLVTAGIAEAFHHKAIAKTYQKAVLNCTAVPMEGPAYAGFFVHTHNDDCYDENGNLVCPLPEIKAHEHGADCYITTAVQTCTLPESDGHHHTEDCYTRVKGDLICEESTEPVYNEDGAIIAEGHVHTDECFAWTEELSCDMEEGEGVHHHDDSCFEYVTSLDCAKPEIILHTHTDDCYQKNEDGSIYVDEDGNSWLICGLQEVTEHIHGPECFTSIELDDGIPEVTEETGLTGEGQNQTGSEGGGDGTFVFMDDETAGEETDKDTESGDGETKDGEIKDKETGEESDKDAEDTEKDSDDINKEDSDDVDEKTAGEEEPDVVYARELTEEKDGIRVLTQIPDGAMTEYAQLSLTDYDEEMAKATILSVVNENTEEGEEREISSMLLLDIGFTAGGDPVFPNGTGAIRVTITADEIREMKAPELYHLIWGTAVKVEDAVFNTEAGTAVFDSMGFSPFAVVDLTGEDPVEETAEDQVSVSMPPQSFSGETDSVIVSVEAPEGAFPEGTRMEVTAIELDEETLSNVAEAVASDAATRVKNTQAVDITFYDTEGKPIEPKLPIKVSMKSAIVSESENVALVHLQEAEAVEGEVSETPAPEVVTDAQVVELPDEDNEIQFESDAFSTYIIVETETITVQYLTADGETYNITLTYGPEAEIPAGAGLAVREILQNSEEYLAYLAQAESAVNAGAETGVEAAENSESEEVAEEADEAESGKGTAERVTVTTARFFDITILDAEGNPVEPAAPVDVTIEYAEPAETAENYQVVHFGAETEVLNPAVSGADGSASAFDFQASSFSVFGIVGTETIETTLTTSDGETYRITVNYTKEAEIPKGSKLVAREILSGTEEYDSYRIQTEEALGIYAVPDAVFNDEDYLIEETDGNLVEYNILGNVKPELTFLRLFDITIMHEGEVVEPKVPVEVVITYVEPMNMDDGSSLDVVHFKNGEAEFVDNISVTDDGTEITYEAESFSVYGTARSAVGEGDYIIYRDGNTDYALGYNNGTLERQTIKINNNNIVTSTNDNVVWTFTAATGGYRLSYEVNGTTYYLRDNNGNLATTTNIDQASIWSYSNYRLSTGTDNQTRYLQYANSSFSLNASTNNATIYLAKSAGPVTIKVHYVDENGTELTVVNGRLDWSTDPDTPHAFLVYDIAGYEYVKTTLANGTVIRPILNKSDLWQYTTSTDKSSSITWTDIPLDAETGRLEDIYVVYKKATEPVTGGTPKVKESSATEDPVDPAIHKTSVSNHDGTNTIGLSITADTSPLEVEKLADVIVIVDVSSSMRRHMGTSTTTYESNDTPVGNYTDHDTRMWIAHSAVNALADTLIGDNTDFHDSAGNKLIRMSLISFSDKASLVQDFTENYSEYESAVKGLKTNQGTNWEDALRMANNMEVDSDRATFVIFVTDGNPSYRATRGNLLTMDGYPDTINDEKIDIYADNTYYMYRANTIFGALKEADVRNYNTTLDVAKSIVDHNKNYYAIGIGPASGVTRLQGLTTYAYGGDTTKGADRTKNATDSDELTQAFNDITASIVALLGWGDINMTDGITNLANTVEKSHLVNVDGNFAYWKAEAPEGWGTWSKNVRSGYILGTSGEDLTYPDDYESWDPNEKALYESAYNKGVRLADSNFVSWNPTTENCQKAIYDAESGSVKWDMGHGFVPESGCTYRVTFRVWPSQEAYDILANLKNGTITYTELTDAQKAQIVDLGNGSYSLKTNDKEPNTTYKAARKTGDGVTTSGDPKTLLFNDVGPMPLVPEKMTVKKEWDYDINDSHAADALKFRLLVGGKYYQNDGTFKETTDNAKVLDLTEAERVIGGVTIPAWSNSINIAPGLVVFDNDGRAEVYETGHKYQLEEFDVTLNGESAAQFAGSYEFTTQTVRPMVLTDATHAAELTYLILADENNPVPKGAKTYTIDSETYFVAEGNSSTVVGTNHRKAELDITKIVVNNSEMSDQDLLNDTFTYRVTLNVPEDADLSLITGYEYSQRRPAPANFTLHGYQEGENPLPGDETRFQGEIFRQGTFKYGNQLIGEAFTDAGNGRKTLTMDISLMSDEVLRLTNIPTGTIYTITEVYANYKRANLTSDAQVIPSTDVPSNLASQGYSVTLIQTSATEKEVNGATITGTVTDPNKRYYNQFTNTLENVVDAELKVTKALDGLEWTTDSRYYFKLTAVDGAPLPEGSAGRTQFYISSTTTDHTYTFGKIRFTEAGTYQYKITETNSNWESVAGQVIDGVQYGPEETITVTVAAENGKLKITGITGSENHTVTSSAEGSALTVATTTVTNSSLTLPIKKIDSSTKEQLSGAVFELLDGSAKLYFNSSYLILTADQVKAIIGMEVTAEGAAAAMKAKGISSTFTIGEVTLKGLTLGKEYTLKEVHAPDGYVIAENNSTFKLTRENNETKITTTGNNVFADEDGVTLLISNNPGVELPQTGGPGTALFTALGGLLTVTAGAVLTMRQWKRKTAEG